MWIKAAVFGGLGIVFSNPVLWTMVGLGITIAFHSSCKWDNSVFAREENDNEIDRLTDEEKDNEIDRDQLPDEENDNEIDRLPDEEKDNEIDRLPDDILGDIVSRLTLIEASRTSILSRRWRNFWTTKSELVFTCFSTFDILNKYNTQVANGAAVDQCLQLYSDHGRKLRMFLLPCCFLNGHTRHLVRWMQTLARLDVEVLRLGIFCRTCNRAVPEKEYTFSFKLIDGFSRLKNLRIMNCYVETSFVGQCISLTRIYMVHLPLLSHQLSDILMSCPNLEFLSISRCELPRNLKISGPNLKLTYVEIAYCYNVKKIEISDTNLINAFIDMPVQVEIFLSSLPKMNELHLRVVGMDYRFGDVTRDLPELQHLRIRTPYQVLRLPPTFGAFRKIRELYLLMERDYRDYRQPEGCEKVDLWNFAPVLDACPFLEIFYFALGDPVCEEERNANWPVVRHKHLSFVELSGFSNTQNELEFVKFILTSAQVLRSFILQVCPRRSTTTEGCYIDITEKDSKQIDARVAEAICADLQGHALSIQAQVMLF